MTAYDNDLQDELRQAKEGIKRMATEELRAHRDQLREERRRGGKGRRQGGRDNVISCRLDDSTLEAVDTLVEAGVRATRADAATWLIQVGLKANGELLDEIADSVQQIRRLRQDAASKAQRLTGPATDAPASDAPADDGPTGTRAEDA